MRKQSNAIKIRHTASAHDRLQEAHKLLGITNLLAKEMEDIFNHWSKIKITDKQVKILIQRAMSPNKETLNNLQKGKEGEFSSVFNNMIDNVLEYSLTSPTQHMETTKGTLFGAYNAVTGYFQNVKSYKDGQTKFKSIMTGNAFGKAQSTFNLCKEFASFGIDVLN